MKLYEMYLSESFPLAKKEFIASGAPEDEVLDTVGKYQKYLKQPGFVDDDYKDINYWRKMGFVSLKDYVRQLENRESVNKRIREQTSDFLVIDENAQCKVVVPVTHSASCELGKRSTWCTSHPGQPMFAQYFYTSKHLLIYVISKSNHLDNFAIRYNQEGSTLEVRDLTQQMTDTEANRRMNNIYGMSASQLYKKAEIYLKEIENKRETNRKVDLSNDMLSFLDSPSKSKVNDQLDYYVAQQIKLHTPLKRDENLSNLNQYLEYIETSLSVSADGPKLRMFDQAISRDTKLSTKYIKIRSKYPGVPANVIKQVMRNTDDTPYYTASSVIRDYPGAIDYDSYPVYWLLMIKKDRDFDKGAPIPNHILRLITSDVNTGLELLEVIDLDDIGAITGNEIWSQFIKKVSEEGTPGNVRYLINTLGTTNPDIEKRAITDPLLAYEYHRNLLRGPWPEAEPVLYSQLWTAIQYHKRAYLGFDNHRPEMIKYLDKDNVVNIVKQSSGWNTLVYDYCRTVLGTPLSIEIEKAIIDTVIQHGDSDQISTLVSLNKYRASVYKKNEEFQALREVFTQYTGEIRDVASLFLLIYTIFGTSLRKFDESFMADLRQFTKNMTIGSYSLDYLHELSQNINIPEADTSGYWYNYLVMLIKAGAKVSTSTHASVRLSIFISIDEDYALTKENAMITKKLFDDMPAENLVKFFNNAQALGGRQIKALASTLFFESVILDEYSQDMSKYIAYDYVLSASGVHYAHRDLVIDSVVSHFTKLNISTESLDKFKGSLEYSVNVAALGQKHIIPKMSHMMFDNIISGAKKTITSVSGVDSDEIDQTIANYARFIKTKFAVQGNEE